MTNCLVIGTLIPHLCFSKLELTKLVVALTKLIYPACVATLNELFMPPDSCHWSKQRATKFYKSLFQQNLFKLHLTWKLLISVRLLLIFAVTWSKWEQKSSKKMAEKDAFVKEGRGSRFSMGLFWRVYFWIRSQSVSIYWFRSCEKWENICIIRLLYFHCHAYFINSTFLWS